MINRKAHKQAVQSDIKTLKRFIKKHTKFDTVALFFKNRHEGVYQNAFTLDTDIMVTTNKNGNVVYI